VVSADIETATPPQSGARTIWNDIFGGSICSVLSISYGLSYAALIFSGPLAPFLGDGISITFITTAVLAAVVAIGSSIPVIIAGPDSATSAMVATIAALLGAHALEGNPSADVLATVILGLAVITATSGLFMIVLARLRGGRAMRYVPYPVIGGFLGATGWLIVSGAVRVITDHPLSIDGWEWLTDVRASFHLLAAVGFAAVIAVATRRLTATYTLPALLVGGVIAAHIGFLLAGLSLNEAQATGWTFAAQPAAEMLPLWSKAGSASIQWHLLPSLTGDALATVLVTAVSALVNVTAIEVATHREADLENELRVIGLANLASAAVGGYVGSASISRTTLNQTAGASSRLSGLVVAVIAAVAVVGGPLVVGYLPKFVLGGLLLYLGTDQLYRWVIDSWRRLSRIEYLALLAIIVITVKFGFVAGLIIGTVIGCATFAYSASRINSIKYEFDGFELRSSLDRAREELAVLAARGAEILGLNLQSYLFFGSANRLFNHIKTLLGGRTECRYLLFDFRLVTGIDSSSVYSFTQIKRHAEARGVRLVFVNLPESAAKALRAGGFVLTDVIMMADLDLALEWCENEVIREHQRTNVERGDLLNWFTQALGSGAYAEDLLGRCRRMEFAAGAIVATAGEAANSMYFISEGRIGVMVNAGDAHEVRVRSLGRQTMVGEMGLLASQPRSATLRAEVASVLYELDAEALAQLKSASPVVVEKLLSYVVAVMAERLAFANRTIGLLRR
jgi:SulP family sulfate permease